MDVDINKRILDLYGDPIIARQRRVPVKGANGEPVLENGQPKTTDEIEHLTIGSILRGALFEPLGQDATMEQKIRFAVLGHSLLHDVNPLELTDQDVAQLIPIINRIVVSSVVAMRVMEILKPSSVPEDLKGKFVPKPTDAD